MGSTHSRYRFNWFVFLQRRGDLWHEQHCRCSGNFLPTFYPLSLFSYVDSSGKKTVGNVYAPSIVHAATPTRRTKSLAALWPGLDCRVNSGNTS